MRAACVNCPTELRIVLGSRAYIPCSAAHVLFFVLLRCVMCVFALDDAPTSGPVHYPSFSAFYPTTRELWSGGMACVSRDVEFRNLCNEEILSPEFSHFVSNCFKSPPSA